MGLLVCVFTDETSKGGGSHIRLPQPTHDILLRRHRIVPLGVPGSRAMGQTRNLRVEVWITEESYRLTLGGDGLEVIELLGRRGDDSMEGRTQDVVAPAGEKVGDVDNYCAGLRREVRE